MRKSREEIKGEMMKEAEEVIDELLSWEEETEKPNLSQVEQKVMELRERLSQELARAVIANRRVLRMLQREQDRPQSTAHCGC